jgi:hypothetical protein
MIATTMTTISCAVARMALGFIGASVAPVFASGLAQRVAGPRIPPAARGGHHLPQLPKICSAFWTSGFLPASTIRRPRTSPGSLPRAHHLEVVAPVWHKWFGDPSEQPGQPNQKMASTAAGLSAVQQAYE